MRIDQSTLALLQSYPWPGNVRELQNAIERAVVLSPGPEITASALPAEIHTPAPSPGRATVHIEGLDETLPLAAAIDAFTRLRIRHTLQAADGNQTKAAARLGLPQSNLSRLMKKLGLR